MTKNEQYRQQVRRTFQQMSDQALDYQSTVIRGGIDRVELEREIARRRSGGKRVTT